MADPDRLAQRLTAQLLAGTPARAAADVVERVLAVQAQDPRGARLAIRARSTGLSAADVDVALGNRLLVVSTLNRGTLHLVRSEDYWWLHPLTTPQLAAANRRRLAQEQVSPDAAERGIGAIQRRLGDGPATRDELRSAAASAGVRVEGQAFVHVVLAATLRGLVVRGPMIGHDHAFVLVSDWLGPAPTPASREVALGRLARRYLAGHGPAGDADLARWAGITLTDARRGLAEISREILTRDDGLVVLGKAGDVAPLPPPRLLGSFEPSLLGWTSRDDIAGGHRQLTTTNGLFRPFAMVDGRAVATWSLARGTVTLAPFTRLNRDVRAVLDADALAVHAFLR